MIRIVYDGAPEAGKTTNVAKLGTLMSLQRVGAAKKPGTTGERTEFFDWLDFTGGYLDGRRVRCQLVSVPGQSRLLHRRRYLLEKADAIVFVADSRPDTFEDSSRNFATTVRMVEQLAGPVPLGVILQANKQDLPTALAPPEVAKHIGTSPIMPVIGSIAARGDGVMQTFILAVRLATDRVRALLLGDDLGGLDEHSDTPEALFAAMLELEKAMVAAGGSIPSAAGDDTADLEPASIEIVALDDSDLETVTDDDSTEDEVAPPALPDPPARTRAPTQPVRPIQPAPAPPAPAPPAAAPPAPRREEVGMPRLPPPPPLPPAPPLPRAPSPVARESSAAIAAARLGGESVQPRRAVPHRPARTVSSRLEEALEAAWDTAVLENAEAEQALAEQAQLAREQAAREQAAREQAAREQAERAAREQAALEHAAREQAAREEMAREQAAQLAREQAAREQAAREQAAREEAAREQAAREELAREQAAREQAEREQAEREQAAREQAAREELAREQAAQAAREQAAREQAAREQAAREQAAREQAAREQAEREQAAREQAAREEMAREQAAQAAREQAAREQAAREQAAREQAARERGARPNPLRGGEIPTLPNATEIASGHVWPPVKGRASVAVATSGKVSIPEVVQPWAPAGAFELVTDSGWILHSSARWAYDSESVARHRLLGYVRGQISRGGGIPEGRTLALAKDRDVWRLWLLTPQLQPLSHRIFAALDADDLSVTSMSMKEVLAAMRELRELGLSGKEIAAGMSGLALHDRRLAVLPLDESDEEPRLVLREPFAELVEVIDASMQSNARVRRWFEEEGRTAIERASAQ